MNMNIRIVEIRCPFCGKLETRITSDTSGILEFVCSKTHCKHTFYVINTTVVKSIPGEIAQHFKRNRHETTMV